MTAKYYFYDIETQRFVDIPDFVKKNRIKMVYWDLGGTLVDIPDTMKERILKKISRISQRNIDIDLYSRVLSDEWKSRETRLAQKAIKAVTDEKKEKEYWIGFYTCVLRKLGVWNNSHKKEFAALVKWLATVQSNPKSFELFSYAEETFTALDAMGISVGIISNAFPSARKILEKSNLIEKFGFKEQHIILSYEYNTIKPERAIYSRAIKKAGVKPGEILFIDDRESFVEGAACIGIKALLIKKDAPDQGIPNNSDNKSQELGYNIIHVEYNQDKSIQMGLSLAFDLSSFVRKVIIRVENSLNKFFDDTNRSVNDGAEISNFYRLSGGCGS